MSTKLQPPLSYARRVWITVGIVVVAALGLVAITFASQVVLTILAGALGAVFLDGVASWIGRHLRIGRRVALALVLVLLTGAAVTFLWVVAPTVGSQLDGLTAQVQTAWIDLQERIAAYGWGQWLLHNATPDRLLAAESGMLETVGGALFATVGAVGSLVLVIAFSVYFAISPETYLRGMLWLAPAHRREHLREVLAAIGHALRRWLAGRAMSMTVVGVGTGLGLWALGVPMPGALGIIAGLLSFVPNLGPLLSAIPGILIAWTHEPISALWALCVYVGVQAVDNYVVTPLVEQRAVDLPPSVPLAAQVLLGLAWGAMGVVLATPLTVIVIVAVQMLYIRDVLGDRVEALASVAADPPAPERADEIATPRAPAHS